jgi:hypothetical protein
MVFICSICREKVKTHNGLMRHMNTSTKCREERKKNEDKKNIGIVLDCKPSGLYQVAGEGQQEVSWKGGTKHKLGSQGEGPKLKKERLPDEVLLQKLVIGMGQAGKCKPVEEFCDVSGEKKRLEGMDIMAMPRSPHSRFGDSEFGCNWGESSEEQVEDYLEAESESEPYGGAGSAHGDGFDDVEAESISEEEKDERENMPNQDSKRKTYFDFQEYARKRKDDGIGFSKEQRACASLMHLLLRKKASLDTYEEVMRWHLEQRGLWKGDESLGNSPHFVTREKLLNDLRERFHMGHQYAKPTKVFLPHAQLQVSVWRKEARDIVLSLLTDPRWSDEDWLYFEDDPFAPPPDDYPYLDELNSGDAYRKTYAKLITHNQRQILVPIPLYIDGAVTGQFDNLQVTALKMSIGILNGKARDKEYAWRSLGFVPNYSKEDAKGKMMFKESGHVGYKEIYGDENKGEEERHPNALKVHPATDYHTILGVLLESLKKLIVDGMVVNIKYKGKLYKDCELVFFVPFVKCDGDEGDKLCLHYRSRNSNVQQLCRYCDCPTNETDNPLVKFKYKEEEKLKKLYERKQWDKLKEMSQNPVENAFHGLRFGMHNRRGIHGACPLDMLHAILLGIFMYVRDCFFEQIGPTSQAAMDINGMARNIGVSLTRQSDRDKPRTKFSRGIDKGKLMAKEYTGVLLIMAGLLRSEDGKNKLLNLPRHKFTENQLKDWVMLVDTLLQWEAYLKAGQMKRKDVERLQKKHQWLLHLLKFVGARRKGMGFKLVKFHAILHLAEDICMFGVPMNVDTGSNESHHKRTKVAAKLTQKDPTTFEEQTSKRLDDLHVLDLALLEMGGRALWDYEEGVTSTRADPGGDVRVKEEEIENKHLGGTMFEVYKDETDQLLVRVADARKKKHLNYSYMYSEFLSFVCSIKEVLGQYTDRGLLYVYSEHHRHGLVFRSHPNFRKKGPWRDWAMVRWGGGHSELPAKIWGFIKITNLEKHTERKLPKQLWGGSAVSNGTFAIIESTTWTGPLDADAIFREVRLDVEEKANDGTIMKRKFYLVDVEAFTEPLVVMENQGSKDSYFVMTSRSKWADQFIAWIQKPHEKIDEELGEEDSFS